MTPKDYIINFTKGSLECIKVNPGYCRFNHRCLYNAAHDATRLNHKKFALVIAIKKYPVLHCITVEDDGAFIDNTLGHWSRNYDYYLVKYVYENEFFDIKDIFVSYRDSLKFKIPWYVRMWYMESSLEF